MASEINHELLYGVIGVAICAAAFVSFWTWVASSARFQGYRLRVPARDPLSGAVRFRQVAVVILFDFALYIAYLVLAYDWLIREGSVTWLTSLGQILVILLIYDLMFYWVHRLFHTPFLMRHVHGIHHRVRYPKAVDDFFMHPMDSLWVTTLFFLSIAMVGPVTTTTFIALLFTYAFINNTLHSGLNLPHPCFALTNYLARKHDVHHGKNISANFGSIFPFWDLVFGTSHQCAQELIPVQPQTPD